MDFGHFAVFVQVLNVKVEFKVFYFQNVTHTEVNILAGMFTFEDETPPLVDN